MVSYLDTVDSMLESFISANWHINLLFVTFSVHGKTKAALSSFKTDNFHGETSFLKIINEESTQVYFLCTW